MLNEEQSSVYQRIAVLVNHNCAPTAREFRELTDALLDRIKELEQPAPSPSEPPLVNDVSKAAALAVAALDAAIYVTASPHEWVWSHDQQVAMAKYCVHAAQVLAYAKNALNAILETEGEDAGVIYLSHESTTHRENGIETYDHEFFSPLGDALVALYRGITTPDVQLTQPAPSPTPAEAEAAFARIDEDHVDEQLRCVSCGCDDGHEPTCDMLKVKAVLAARGSGEWSREVPDSKYCWTIFWAERRWSRPTPSTRDAELERIELAASDVVMLNYRYAEAVPPTLPPPPAEPGKADA